MESLAGLLEPYRDLIATSTTTISNFQQLSGALVCNDIRKQKSTAGFTVLPFLFGVVLSVMFAIFGVILNDTPMIQVSLIGVATNAIYTCFFLWYTNNAKDKKLVWTQIVYGAAFVATVFVYACIENPKKLPYRYGILTTAALFYSVGWPLLGLREIIRKKRIEGLPFPIILSGTVVSFLWFLYGVVTRQHFVIFQNSVLLLMSIVQLSLFAIYPSTKSVKIGNLSKSTNSDNNQRKHFSYRRLLNV